MPAAHQVRCAIYTRKSTDEGLSQEFNSLDAQREAGEAYIASQRHEGWLALPARYDDGGYTGANMERPALKRLLADVRAGGVDCVVVYKVDRLTRSLLDFSRIVEVLDKHGVSFVAVTQQFNTTSSLGRLTLNMLLSFAQFERELISERTRDKMSAARRKGKWTGGHPVLGYDVHPGGGRLVINEDEAARVRAIFDLYLECRSLVTVAREVNRRGWTTKQWTSSEGREHRGRPFGKSDLYRTLRNIIYTGQVDHKGTVYPGEHPAIVDAATFQKVGECLRHNGLTGGKEVRNKYGALLKRLIYCDACGTAMVHAYTLNQGRRYRYYVCLNAQQRGWDSCPSKSLSAGEIEDFVFQRIRDIGKDPRVTAETLRLARQQSEARTTELRSELNSQERTLQRLCQELMKIAGTSASGNGIRLDRMADLQEQIRAAEGRVGNLRRELDTLATDDIDEDGLFAALEAFEPVWKSMNAMEQIRLIRAIVERVGYDGRTGRVALTFSSAGFKAICEAAGRRRRD
jgi:site-specific DNA recombinase